MVFGGLFDLVANAGLGLLVGIAAFGVSFAALILAAAIYVSSSAIAVKGLIDFRRLADDETDLVLAILIAEDIAIALVLGFAAGGGGAAGATLAIVAKAIGFIAVSLALSKWLAGPIDRLLDWLPREMFLLAVFGFLIGMAAVADALGLSEAIGALMAGVVLSETSMREEIEERFFSFRDIFAALFFFVFGLSIDISALGDVGWLLALAVPAAVIGKIATGHVAGRLGGFSARQSFNAGVALIAHGEFTIILAQVALGERRAAGRPAGDPDRVRRALRPDYGDHRRDPDEGVEGARSPSVPCPYTGRRRLTRCPLNSRRPAFPGSGRSSRSGPARAPA